MRATDRCGLEVLRGGADRGKGIGGTGGAGDGPARRGSGCPTRSGRAAAERIEDPVPESAGSSSTLSGGALGRAGGRGTDPLKQAVRLRELDDAGDASPWPAGRPGRRDRDGVARCGVQVGRRLLGEQDPGIGARPGCEPRRGTARGSRRADPARRPVRWSGCCRRSLADRPVLVPETHRSVAGGHPPRLAACASTAAASAPGCTWTCQSTPTPRTARSVMVACEWARNAPSDASRATATAIPAAAASSRPGRRRSSPPHPDGDHPGAPGTASGSGSGGSAAGRRAWSTAAPIGGRSAGRGWPPPVPRPARRPPTAARRPPVDRPAWSSCPVGSSARISAGPTGEHPRHGDSLGLTTGQFMGQRGGQFADADLVRADRAAPHGVGVIGCRPAAAGRPRFPARPTPGAGSVPGIRCRPGPGWSDGWPPKPGQDNAPAVTDVQPGHQVQQGGFAGPGRPGDARPGCLAPPGRSSHARRPRPCRRSRRCGRLNAGHQRAPYQWPAPHQPCHGSTGSRRRRPA